MIIFWYFLKDLMQDHTHARFYSYSLIGSGWLQLKDLHVVVSLTLRSEI